MSTARRHDGVTLRLLTVPERYTPALARFAREFETATGARVELELAPTWWQLAPRIAAHLESAEPRYDLFCNDVEFQYTLRPHLLRLDGLFARPDLELDDLFGPVRRSSITPPEDPAARYGVPVRVRVPVVFYRTDLIPSFPATWEEYGRLLAAQTGGDRHGFGFAGGYNEQTTKLWLARYWASGEPLLDPSGKARIAGDAGVEALERLRRETHRHAPAGVHGWDHEYAGQMFREGRVAMLEGLAHPTLDGIEEPRFSAIAGRWSAAAYPGRGASVFTSPHLVAFRSSRHPEAALDFLAHCARRESGRKILLDHHEFAARPSVWREAAAAGIPVPAAPLDGIAAALDRGIPFLPWVPQWLEMLRVLWDRIAACLGGRVEPKAALGETAREWDRLVAAQPLRFPYRE